MNKNKKQKDAKYKMSADKLCVQARQILLVIMVEKFSGLVMLIY